MNYNNEEQPAIYMKIILTGDSGSGKTCLLNRWAEDTFQESYLATIGVDFKMKKLNFQGKPFKVQMWDTAGQERFRSITANYYKGCTANIIVCDVTRNDCLESAENWLGEAEKFAYCSNSKKTFLFVTKTDIGYLGVSKDAVMSFADRHNLMIFETSSKSGCNVQESFNIVFEILATELLYQNSDAQRQKDQGLANDPLIIKKQDKSFGSKCKC